MPNQNTLINAIMINEAKASSEIENIVTTHDEIYKAMIEHNKTSIYAKEVVDYRSAMYTYITEYIGKIGLIYLSDYSYATSGNSMVDRNTCLSASTKQRRNIRLFK